MVKKLNLITIQSSKEPYLTSAEQTFKEKIDRFSQIEILKIKSSNAPREAKKRKVEEEGLKIQKHMKDSFNIVFDENGEHLSSEEFAALLKSSIESSAKTINLIVGGAFGLSEKVKQEASRSVSLSPMVMNHHVAEIVVLEQIYRAFMINSNRAYHNP